MEPKKLLVVDDSKLIHKMFEVMLRVYPQVHAMDGREGLQRLGEHADIDLILLDINMPTMDGLEFLAEIKRDAAFADLPVIVISTEGKDEDTDRALAAGANAYITKPFRSDQVISAIAELAV